MTTLTTYWTPDSDPSPVQVLLDKPDLPEVALSAIAGLTWRITGIGQGLYDGWVRVKPSHPDLPEEIAVRRTEIVPDPTL